MDRELQDVMDRLGGYMNTRSRAYAAEKWEILHEVQTVLPHVSFERFCFLYDATFSLLWQQMDDFVTTQTDIAEGLIKPALGRFSEYPLPGGDRIGWVINNATIGMYAPFKNVLGYLLGMQPCDVFVTGAYDGAAMQRMKDCGHRVYVVGGSPEDKVANIRATCEAQGIGTLIADIYLSVPLALFAMRSAPLQLYLTPGFQLFPCDYVLMTDAQKPIADNCVEIPAVTMPMRAEPKVRQDKFVFGCLSRFEKMSDTYLDMVSDVLDAVPGAEFHAYGRGEFPGKHPRMINKGFEDALEALAKIDVYLDTWPVCSATSAWEAMVSGPRS
jgi:hypothetical protein